MRVVIAGSSGLIGSALIPALEGAGHEVVRLVRPGTPGEGIAWDPEAGTIDAAALEGADAVVNLAGRSIGARRWTAVEKALVRSSRVGATALLASTLASLQDPPRVLLNASAVGFYGDRGDAVMDEEAGPGEGFFPEVCAAWERAAAPAASAGIRVAYLRSGIVLARRGGALARVLAPFGPAWLSPYRWGLGGWIGDGRSWWPWISLRDEVRAILHLLDSTLAGPVNLAAPEPARNKDFLRAVGRALRRPVWLPIPRFVLRLVLGSDLAEATLFDSMRVVPARLAADGFAFEDTDLDAALHAALGPDAA
ncbi:MAG: TIGR01777 family oxidoreductase [Actinobacteria bacterium]|nr:TIGR01777 family oxidoreductase [Actinomycetota bacterium]